MSRSSSSHEGHEGASEPVRTAVGHGLAWLVFGNALGVMIAILLLLPGLNTLLGEWTYGRWMMVHMNTALYGWCSLRRPRSGRCRGACVRTRARVPRARRRRPRRVPKDSRENKA